MKPIVSFRREEDLSKEGEEWRDNVYDTKQSSGLPTTKITAEY